jgi:hypothetical protein
MRMPLRKLSIFVCLALAAAILVAAEPSPFPDTAEGKRLAAFFAAAQLQDEKATRAFIEQNFPAEALKELPVENRLRNIHGFIARQAPFEILRMLPPRPGAAGVLARSRKTGTLLQIFLELEEGPRRGVLGLRVEEDTGEAPEKPAETPKANDTELAAAVDAEVTALAARDAFSGVVLLARGGPAEPAPPEAWTRPPRTCSPSLAPAAWASPAAPRAQTRCSRRPDKTA